MKFKKTDYCIIGRFENGSKYRIVTRKEVSGYTTDEFPGVAFRKHNDFWYVDHIITGLGIVSVGCKTRNAAIAEYKEHYIDAIELFRKKDSFKRAVENYDNAPLESDVAMWESINYCTTYNWRFDKVTDAARRAGLIIKKADDAAYIDGGNIDIIGNADALKSIKEMIEGFERHDMEQAEEQKTDQPAADPEKKERAKNILKGEDVKKMTFTKDSITAGGKTFPCEYSTTETGAILVFAIVGEKEDGRKEKQRIRIEEGNPHYAAAMKAAKQAGAVKKAAKKAAAKKAEPAPEVKEEKAAAPVPEEKTEEPAPVPEPVKAEEPAGDPEPVKAAADPKQARGPVKEKDFIGKEITGRGWRILFDGEAARTRVIFEGTPEPAAKQAVEEARFFWSPNMKSFNKKLTFKAYRAAVKLADTLNEIYAA